MIIFGDVMCLGFKVDKILLRSVRWLCTKCHFLHLCTRIYPPLLMGCKENKKGSVHNFHSALDRGNRKKHIGVMAHDAGAAKK